MASETERFAEAVIDVCDFGCFEHIVDVGGGDGMFLAKYWPATRTCVARRSISRT